MMSDTFGALAPQDELQPPPRNPAAPPDAIAAAIRSALQHNIDWAKVPGLMAQGVQPTTPGQWSEEDEFRKQHLNATADQWGPQTAMSEVFWPRTGTNVGGSGFAVGSGAMPPKLPPNWRNFTEFGRLEQKTDAAHAAIQDALKAGRSPNSGVPLVNPPIGPRATSEEALHAISDALKIAPTGSAMPQTAGISDQLIAMKPKRVEFDARISSLAEELNARDLRSVVESVVGYPVTTAKSKSDLVTALKRHQRQWELNADRSAAQDKIKP